MNILLTTSSSIPLTCNLKSSHLISSTGEWINQVKYRNEINSSNKIKLGSGPKKEENDLFEASIVTEIDSKLHKNLIFKDCQIVLDLPTSFPLQLKQNLKKKIINNGGQISYAVTKNAKLLVTVAVIGSDSIQTLKQKNATKLGIPAVTEDYIDACIVQQKLLDCRPYLLIKKYCADAFQKGKVIAATKNKAPISSGTKTPLALVPVHPYEGLNDYDLVKALLFKGRSSEACKSGHSSKDDKMSPFAFCALELHVLSEKTVDNDSHKFCIFTHEGTLTGKEVGKTAEFGTKKCRYAQSVEEALSIYSQIYWKMTGPPNNMQQSREILHPSIGSPAFCKLQVGWSLTMPTLEPPVLYLVDLMWTEAIGKLSDFLTLQPCNIPVWKVDEAEGILLQIYSVIKEKNSEDLLHRLSEEFYSVLPHHTEHHQPIVNSQVLSQKLDLCQVLRDMVTVSEASGWAPKGHLQAKYRSLRCHINDLDPESLEFCNVQEMVMNSQTRDTNIKIQNVYQVQRDLEPLEFTHQLPNCQFMFHSTSSSNLVGILSRGLLLPRVVTEEHGIRRTDAGLLGGGIYFSDSSSTCVKYSKVNQKRNTRFLLICKVALGCTFQTRKFDPSLKVPPEGFQSIHGVKSTESEPSDFVDDEFVVYSSNQQQMCYLVEFSLPEDGDVIQHPWFQENFLYQPSLLPEATEDDSWSTDISDIVDAGDKHPSQCKLQGVTVSGVFDLPLKEVHVVGHLVDLVAKVTVFQVYKNSLFVPLEARYVFPLETGAAVCGFEAYINGKHIIGQVKEKVIAHEEYKEAIKKGHGAYLMDEDSHDIFTVSVGNLPPNATVIIRISYVLELPVEGDLIRFSVPVSVAPGSEQKALGQQIQDSVGTMDVRPVQKFNSLRVNVQMPFVIQKIYSPSHQISLKKTDTKAVVELNDSISTGDFNLLISLAEIHMPRMWLEKHPSQQTHACMLTFYPEIESPEIICNEIVILIDVSNSMKGTPFQDALKVSLLCLKMLPSNSIFNVVAFGSVFQELFPSSQACNRDTILSAELFLKNLAPNLGNTELFQSLHSYHILAGGHLTNVLLISDGHINNEGVVIHSVRHNSSNVRIFTLGISATANKHFLKKLAHDGSGAYEFFDPSFHHDWKKKVQSQLEKTAQPAITNVCVEWQNAESEAIVQAPHHIMSLFTGCRQVVYSFISNCTMATLKAEIDGQEISTVVSTSELHETSDTLLHTLTSRAIINDWEYGILAEDRLDSLVEKKAQERKIIELSKQYSLVTSLTSFIAVEERNEQSNKDSNMDINIFELLAEEDDILPYMSFDSATPLKPASGYVGKLASSSAFFDCKKRSKTSIDNLQVKSLKKKKKIYANGECILESASPPPCAFPMEESLISAKDFRPYCNYLSSLVPDTPSDRLHISNKRCAPLKGKLQFQNQHEQKMPSGIVFGCSELVLGQSKQQSNYASSSISMSLPCEFSAAPLNTMQFRAFSPCAAMKNSEESVLERDDLLLCCSLYSYEHSGSDNSSLSINGASREDKQDHIILTVPDFCSIITGAVHSKGGGLPFCKVLLKYLKTELLDMQDSLCFSELPLEFSSFNIEINGVTFQPEDIIKWQNKDGSWSKEDILRLGIVKENIFQELQNCGLKSLGKKAALDIERLVSTVTMIFYILYTIIYMSKEQLSNPSLLETLAEQLAELSVSVCASNYLHLAAEFATLIDKKHPLAYNILRLGKNWEGFVLTHILQDFHPQNLCYRIN